MKNCLKCGRLNIRQSEKYCPDCGSSNISADQLGLATAGGAVAKIGPTAPKALRILAFSVDLVGLCILSLSSFPVIGLIAALLAFLYQLLRDYRGASFGKVLLHLKVIGRSGNKVTTQQCIVRNAIFVAPFLAFFVPGLGLLAGAPLALAIYIVELILVLTTDHRLGDRMAGTIVVKCS